MATEGVGAQAEPPRQTHEAPATAVERRTLRDRALGFAWYWPVPAIALVAVAGAVDRLVAVAVAAALVAGAGALAAKAARSRARTVLAFGVALVILGALVVRESAEHSGEEQRSHVLAPLSREQVEATQDLRGAMLSGASLAGLDLTGRGLQGVRAERVDLWARSSVPRGRWGRPS